MGGVVQYIGEWEDGKFHGIGSCQYKDGSEYSGAFERGRRHGTGILVLASGDRYEGQWWQGLRHSQGVSFSKASGSTREGAWKRGVEVSDGEWLITFANGDKYSGAYHRGRPWGKGTCKFANGAAYTGEWVDGLREGHGVCVNPDGSILEGEWQHSVFVKAVRTPSRFVEVSLSSNTPPPSPKRLSLATEAEQGGKLTPHPECGVHRYVYSNGDVYDGEFKEGYRHGFGLFTERATGSSYEGQWTDQGTQGSGKVIYNMAKAPLYQITAIDEPVDGEWTITFPDSSKFIGECVGGRPHGRGLCKYAGGDLYDGMWVNGKRHGVGSGFFANGESFVGQWENNHVALNGQGKLTLADGTVHVYAK
ncbi:hypothetical protein BBJ29_001440 [Phytophthora kernoviae]|uniref:MORN repeat-containing protein 5 n=1 Tax=Phytophthora kernoviae TaxID=325452 RepID=A0A3F2RZZ9_9STRA|nr:hypothetical protein BBJ29_001440 [Phytophthora kernoviae]RLN66692.1 hypothetical protein BBP00_00002035 [Phytophthora kernoviae]